MAQGWVYFHQMLNVWVNYSFKFKIICLNMDVVLPLLLCRFLGRFSLDAGTWMQGFALVQTQTSLRSGMFCESLAYCFIVVWPVHKSLHFFIDHILCTGAFPSFFVYEELLDVSLIRFSHGALCAIRVKLLFSSSESSREYTPGFETIKYLEAQAYWVLINHTMASYSFCVY